MSWGLSFQLHPGETVIEDSSLEDKNLVKSVYSVLLTERRVVFRFNGFGSKLCKSFMYGEIKGIQTTTRLFVSYLRITTYTHDELFNVCDADYLANRIRECKAMYSEEALPPVSSPSPLLSEESSPAKRKKNLYNMLLALKEHGLLTDDEFKKKVEQLDSIG